MGREKRIYEQNCMIMANTMFCASLTKSYTWNGIDRAIQQHFPGATSYPIFALSPRNIYYGQQSNTAAGWVEERTAYNLRRLRMSKDQQRNEEIQPRTGKLSAEEVAKMHEVFVETGGYVNETARRTGSAKSTVSRYARKRGWHKEILYSDSNQSNRQTEMRNIVSKLPLSDKNNRKTVLTEGKGNGDAEEQIMPKLIALRKLLFEEIIGDENPEVIDGPPLKILPRTLAEAIKALIDIDKRITEREGNQPITMLDTYQNILARCARIMEDKSE